MKNILVPKTYLGKWSVGLMIAFFVLLGLLQLLVALGETGGNTFFSNLRLAIPGLFAGISGVATFFTGLVSIIRNKERSVFVFLSTTIGFFVLIFVLGEISVPH